VFVTTIYTIYHRVSILTSISGRKRNNEPPQKCGGSLSARQRTQQEAAFKCFAGELEGGRSPASNRINSCQSLAAQGFGERSDAFCKYSVLQKTRRFETVKISFLTVSMSRRKNAAAHYQRVKDSARSGLQRFRRGPLRPYFAMSSLMVSPRILMPLSMFSSEELE
jgi:hypothetical protein